MIRYTERDPRFEITCASCRFGEHDCRKFLVVVADPLIPDGRYPCPCLRCRVAS